VVKPSFSLAPNEHQVELTDQNYLQVVNLVNYSLLKLSVFVELGSGYSIRPKIKTL